MWIAILGVSAVALIGIWACCYVASEADDNITEEWNKNWVGQKFDNASQKSKK